MTRRIACLAALSIVLGGLTSPARLHAQLPPDKALAAMKPADGFQVELFASEIDPKNPAAKPQPGETPRPFVANPTTIDVDHKGRVWVAEAVNYRRVNFGRPILRPEGDRIVVLVDRDADGKADEAVTFYQGKEIYGPLGVCVAPLVSPDRKGGESLRVFVCQSPDILVFDDKDGDLKADGPPRKFLTGFGGFDHDHGVHGINIGPDGKLYFTVGDSGVGRGTDRDKKPVPPLTSADGKGRKWVTNDTDVRAGTVWRCDMDGNNLELIAHNFRNNYECCVDSFGEVWLSDNDDDGNMQTRICFVMPGGNYGYYPRGPGQTHWHEEQPGIVHKTLRTGFGSPTGITFYEGSLFSGRYRGALLHCDAGPREVRAFFRRPKGAGYELDKEVILTSSDNFFRPSDVAVAPDGSIFVADWYDRGVGGHGMGDPWDGRIYRLTPNGHKGYKVPEVKLDTTEGILAALGNSCQATRALAIAYIHSLPFEDSLALVRKLALQTEDPIVAARALCQGPALTQRQKFQGGIGYGMWESRLKEQFAQLVIRQTHAEGFLIASPPHGSESPGQLRELALHLRHYPHSDTNSPNRNFYALAKLYDGSDHFYRAALNIALGTDPARRDAILADFDKHFPEWNDKVADLVWELRPKSVMPRLQKLLADPKLTATQKARIVDIVAASDDANAGQAMLALLLSDAPDPVKARALDQLRLFLPTRWKDLQGSEGLAAAIKQLFAEPNTRITGLQLVAAAGDPRRAEAVAPIAGDTASPREVRAEAVRTLGKLRSARSVEALKAVLAEDTRNNAPLLKVEAVNALAALVTGQGKDDVSPKALAVLHGLITETGTGLELQKAALEALAGTRPGTIWLLDLHAQKKLPGPLVADAGRLLRNSPFQGERNKALLLFPAPGKLNPKALPPIPELAKRTGNAGRGKQVWDASLAGAAQCAKCHMVRGVGGQVGPDLSMIGKKASKENLFESILLPSKAIAHEYVQHQVTTGAGLTVSGLLVADTPAAITLRDANGKDTVIRRDDIEGPVRQLKVSIMPEDIVAALTEDELIDLVAYLQTLQTPSLTPDAFHIAGPFRAADMTAALDRERGPEKGPFNPSQVFEGAEPGDRIKRPVKWGTIRPDARGYFDLAALLGKDGANSASYMLVEVESPADQDGEVLLGTDDGAKLWVNGKEVFHTEATRAAAPEQDRVPVKLTKGKNTVLLKVANGNNPHGFYFTLVTKDEVKVAARK